MAATEAATVATLYVLLDHAHGVSLFWQLLNAGSVRHGSHRGSHSGDALRAAGP